MAGQMVCQVTFKEELRQIMKSSSWHCINNHLLGFIRLPGKSEGTSGWQSEFIINHINKLQPEIQKG